MMADPGRRLQWLGTRYRCYFKSKTRNVTPQALTCLKERLLFDFMVH